MIGPNPLAEALISVLLADTTLTAWLASRNAPEEIRELGYQGREFVYPAVRTDIGTETPQGDGPCYPFISDLAFRVYVYSEKNSSYECGELSKLVYDALFLSRLEGDDFGSNHIFVDSIPRPQRVGENLWRAVLPCRVQANGGLSP